MKSLNKSLRKYTINSRIRKNIYEYKELQDSEDTKLYREEQQSKNAESRDKNEFNKWMSAIDEPVNEFEKRIKI